MHAPSNRRLLLEHLKCGPAPVDEMAALIGRPSNVVSATMCDFIRKGLVRRLPSGWYAAARALPVADPPDLFEGLTREQVANLRRMEGNRWA